jgi:hypothetical protein
VFLCALQIKVALPAPYKDTDVDIANWADSMLEGYEKEEKENRVKAEREAEEKEAKRRVEREKAKVRLQLLSGCTGSRHFLY